MNVLFAVMPFADVSRPAMGVSLLVAEARQAGFSASVEYFNVGLAERIGPNLYQTIARSFPPETLVGEWFFADDVFGDEIPDPQEYLNDILGVLGSDNQLIQDLDGARQRERGAYLDECAAAILAAGPDVVGFTTTFHQTCGSLAVAKRLKQAPNPPIIVFGGANCEGEMGLQMIRSFPWIDYVCSGESDHSLPRLLKRIAESSSDPIPGVVDRHTDAVAVSEGVRDMDALPFPDFDDYFGRVRRSSNRTLARLAADGNGHVVLETSRGCWWGAKHHCTFCGLNGDTMAFRSKSPDRALAEIQYLIERHQTTNIMVVDNILDMRYVDTLFPRLEASGLDLKLFYEVKANLRYAQLEKMRRGGLRTIQPGIESFSNQVLQLMQKGCTGFQNVQLMRWCEELGVEVAWNILAGFPGESPSEYARMAELMPDLTHLTPPTFCGKVRLDRFSPFHTRAAEFGFKRLRAARAYRYVFPLADDDVMRLAYFFDFDYDDDRDVDSYLGACNHEVQLWWAARSKPGGNQARLDAFCEDKNVRVVDTRPVAVAPVHRLTGLPALLLAECDVISKPSALAARHPESTEDEIMAILEDLRSRRLVIEADGRYLSLPVFRKRWRNIGAAAGDDTRQREPALRAGQRQPEEVASGATV